MFVTDRTARRPLALCAIPTTYAAWMRVFSRFGQNPPVDSVVGPFAGLAAGSWVLSEFDANRLADMKMLRASMMVLQEVARQIGGEEIALKMVADLRQMLDLISFDPLSEAESRALAQAIEARVLAFENQLLDDAAR
jgi:hypothetical protein